MQDPDSTGLLGALAKGGAGHAWKFRRTRLERNDPILVLKHSHAKSAGTRAHAAQIGAERVGLDPYGSMHPGCLGGPDVDLSADLAVPLSMALHELSANAARYGALSARLAWRWNGA